MVNLLQNFNLNAAAFASHRDKINTFLQLREIPAEMQLRVHRYLDEIWLLKHGVDEQEVLSSLPHFIRHDLSWFLNQQFLEKIPMFFGIMLFPMLVLALAERVTILPTLVGRMWALLNSVMNQQVLIHPRCLKSIGISR